MSGLMEVAAESAVQAQAPSGARDLAGSAADSVALRADVPPPLRALSCAKYKSIVCLLSAPILAAGREGNTCKTPSILPGSGLRS